MILMNIVIIKMNGNSDKPYKDYFSIIHIDEYIYIKNKSTK